MSFDLGDHAETPIDVTLSLEARLTGPLCGLGTKLRVMKPEDPSDTIGVVSIAGLMGGDNRVAFPIGAASFDARVARARSLGELIERYTACFGQRWSRTQSASFDELGSIALDPSRFALPSAEERTKHDLVEYRSDLKVLWLDGWKLSTGGLLEPAKIPRQLVFARLSREGEPFFHRVAVTGFAAGNTIAEAVRSGLIEVLERDAFALTWLGRVPVPEIDPSAFEGDVRRWREHHQSRGREAKLNDLTTDLGVPVVIAQLFQEGPWRYITGFGAALDPQRAMRRAIEDIENLRELLSLTVKTRRIPAEGADLVEFEDWILSWQRPGRRDEIPFLTNSGKTGNAPRAVAGSSTPKRDIETIVGLLASKNLQVFALDLTPPELRGLPLRVVKVVVPGAQQTSYGQTPWCLEGPRLRGAAPPFNANPAPIL